MSNSLIHLNGNPVSLFIDPDSVPAIIAHIGDEASYRFLEYFTASARNSKLSLAFW